MERFTAIFEHHPPWWIAWIQELPGVNTQGATLAEAMENLIEAVELIQEELPEERESHEAAGVAGPSALP